MVVALVGGAYFIKMWDGRMMKGAGLGLVLVEQGRAQVYALPCLSPTLLVWRGCERCRSE